MNPVLALFAAGVLLATTSGAAVAAPIPLPRFKPSLAELSNFRAMPEDARAAMYRSLAVRLDARVEADPDDLEAWLRLARTRTLLGEYQAAIEAFRNALRLAPRSPSILREYAAIELGEVDPATGWPLVTPEALKLYQRLVRLDPGDTEARWYLGLHALQQGDREAAGEHWRILLRLLPPGDAGAEAIRERLDALHAVVELPAS